MNPLENLRPFVRARLAHIADGFAVAVAVSLPWSTSAASLLIVLCLLTLVPALDPIDVRQEIATAGGGLPLAMLVLAILGMTWADVSWGERLGGLDSFFKLMTIPLLIVHFRHSDHALRVMVGYLASCTALLVLSFIFVLWPQAAFTSTEELGVPVKNALTQSEEFVACGFALLFLAIEFLRRERRTLAVGILAFALVFLVNAVCITMSLGPVLIIHALLIIPVLLVLLGFKQWSVKRMVGLLAAGAMLGAVLWVSSSYLRHRTVTVWEHVRPYPGEDKNWAGAWPEFWRKSLIFIGEAPVLGHGTGSIHKLFATSAIGQSGYSATVTPNPHQQTLAVWIQLGLVGVTVLWAMWVSHLLLFRGNSLPEWIGLVVVTQNIVGSLLDSYLFAFTQGWVYVFGVGVAGGMFRRLSAGEAVREQPVGGVAVEARSAGMDRHRARCSLNG